MIQCILSCREASHRSTHTVGAWGGTCGELNEYDLNVLQSFPAHAKDNHFYRHHYGVTFKLTNAF